MRAWWGTTRLFVRELWVGLRRGAQHRYMLIGLVTGLVLLMVFQIGRTILHDHVYQTLLGHAGGARVWMDGLKPLKDRLEDPEFVAGLRLGDGRRLALFPYEEVGARTLAPLGLHENKPFRGRLIPGDHPVGKALRPVGGAGGKALGLGFLAPADRPAQAPDCLGRGSGGGHLSGVARHSGHRLAGPGATGAGGTS